MARRREAVWVWGLALLLGAAAGCGRRAPEPSVRRPPAPSGEEAALLARVRAFPELAGCAAAAGDGGAAVRLTDVDLAGEAARVRFACGTAVKGTATFFRVAGKWMPSTRSLTGSDDGGGAR